MADDYALLAKLQDLDEAIDCAEYWWHEYRTETNQQFRPTALRFYLANYDAARELMRVVAEHGRGE